MKNKDAKTVSRKELEQLPVMRLQSGGNISAKQIADFANQIRFNTPSSEYERLGQSFGVTGAKTYEDVISAAGQKFGVSNAQIAEATGLPTFLSAAIQEAKTPEQRQADFLAQFPPRPPPSPVQSLPTLTRPDPTDPTPPPPSYPTTPPPPISLPPISDRPVVPIDVPSMDTVFRDSPVRTWDPVAQSFRYTTGASLAPATGSGSSFVPPVITSRKRNLLNVRMNEIDPLTGLPLFSEGYDPVTGVYTPPVSSSSQFAARRAGILTAFNSALSGKDFNTRQYFTLLSRARAGAFGDYKDPGFADKVRTAFDSLPKDPEPTPPVETQPPVTPPPFDPS
jgi:hypothetical protein